MSDKYTSVEIDVGGGLGLWDHVDPAEAIRQTRAFYDEQRAFAEKVLAGLDAGDVKVFHQYGPWARGRRRCVFPEVAS